MNYENLVIIGVLFGSVCGWLTCWFSFERPWRRTGFEILAFDVFKREHATKCRCGYISFTVDRGRYLFCPRCGASAQWVHVLEEWRKKGCPEESP